VREPAFIKNFPPESKIWRLPSRADFPTLEFESARPSVVKSIKQRDLLNTWLRLYARTQALPRMAEYQPARMEDEAPDLVYYSIDPAPQPPRLTILSDGTRMSTA
jgi:hypothetical protein